MKTKGKKKTEEEIPYLLPNCGTTMKNVTKVHVVRIPEGTERDISSIWSNNDWEYTQNPQNPCQKPKLHMRTSYSNWRKSKIKEKKYWKKPDQKNTLLIQE